MTVTISALKVFEIAEQIERNGTSFYRKAAEMFNEPNICNMFLELADWETKHEQVFRDMREQLSKLNSKPRIFRPEKTQPDPQVIASLTVFGAGSEPVHKLKNIENVAGVLKRAIKKEKDSIAFFKNLKDLVPVNADKDKVDDIIEEEIRHIKILRQALEPRE